MRVPIQRRPQRSEELKFDWAHDVSLTLLPIPHDPLQWLPKKLVGQLGGQVVPFDELGERQDPFVGSVGQRVDRKN